MEENERENMENTDRNREIPASDAPSVDPEQATKAPEAPETPEQPDTEIPASDSPSAALTPVPEDVTLSLVPKSPKKPEDPEAAKTREQLAREAAEAAGDKAYQNSQDMPFPRLILHENWNYAEPRTWLVAIVLAGLGVLLCLVLSVTVKWGIHLKSLEPYVSAYDGYMIRQGSMMLEGREEWVVLRKRGKAEVRLEGDRSKARWDCENGNITLKLKGKTYGGTLKNGVLTLMFNQQEHIFLEESLEIPELGEPVPTMTQPPETREAEFITLPPAELSYPGWQEEYYGWWIRKDPGESWHSGQEFAFWDVCATLTPVGANEADLKLWDSVTDPGELRGSAQVRFQSGASEMGQMTLVRGSLRGEPMEPWTVEPEAELVPDMLTIEGSTGTFDFLIFLRPWGMGWEDVNNYAGRYFNDMMPAHYTDWYENYMEGDMPEYFVGLVFPKVDRG